MSDEQISNASVSEEIFTIPGYLQKLESGAKVWVGVSPMEKGSVYLKFTNPEGIDTKLCLSFEAMSAVVELWTRIAIRNASVFSWKVELNEDEGALICTAKDPS